MKHILQKRIIEFKLSLSLSFSLFLFSRNFLNKRNFIYAGLFLIINSENQTKRSNSLTGVWNLSETSIIVMVVNILLYYLKIITVITVLSSTKIIQFLVHFFFLPNLPFCVLMFDYIYLDLIFSEIRETTFLFIENPRRYNNFYNNIFI